MSPFVHGALVTALLLSALGAVVVCLMVLLYGFVGPDDEPPLTTARRLMYTRIGHALATTCFAATAILVVMVLVRSGRPASTPVVLDTRVPALDARIDQQSSRMASIETRAQIANAGVTRTETRLNDLEQSLRQLNDEGRRTEHRIGRLEQAELRAAVPERPAAVRKTPVAARGAEVTPSRLIERPVPVSPPPAAPVASAPPSPAAERFASASPSSASPSSASPSSASPASASPASASPPPALTPPSASVADAPPASMAVSSRDREVVASSGSPTPASPSGGFRAKLQRDWEAIQKGFESSGDDIRRAWDGTKRKFREIVD